MHQALKLQTKSRPLDNPDKKPAQKGFLSAESARAFGKYVGMASQMGAILVIGVLGGKRLDQWLHTDQTFTLIRSLLAVFLAIYIPLKDFIFPADQ